MMKGTKKMEHGGMGMMPKRSGGDMHGSMGKAMKGGGKTSMEGKATSHAAGHPHCSMKEGSGPVKMPKTRPASFGK